MKYDVIFFDLDDTLFDFGQSEKAALHKTFVTFGLPDGFNKYHANYREISNVLWRELEQGKLSVSALGVERFRRLFATNQIDIDAAEFNGTYLGNLGKEVYLMDGVEELFDSLSDQRLAIITNGFRNVQLAKMESSPLYNTFEQIIISEDAGFQKPDKRIFDYAFSKLGLTDKATSLMVGDSLTSDMQGGINYGIDTCWFNPNHKENSIGIKPTYEIDHLTQLIDIVK
ncbi:YjjG family noncanonical pyrimidine nucleotidase [Oceanobacillus sp. J11TS1]|uniref:YjjG family noncanonical pyrimidine nucleotidase n=1 Tax=Oceanobacillus sp. J11TS1 TaxID=2807191 RepID=UPI001B035226|nr:YjjG family noncanonical pyrimidine nucleotidase [Oceanobacillus sp. J11TS1]GIO23781.1 noncanonical pyrimidine nucleotidase, YjjG family protein [Oceanobacillus sp. J11TS1]